MDFEACRLNGRSVFSVMGFVSTWKPSDSSRADGLAGRLIRQRHEKIHLVFIERGVTLGRSCSMIFSSQLSCFVSLLHLAHLEKDPRDDDGRGDNEYDNERRSMRYRDPLPEKSGLRFSRNALMPSAPSSLAACDAMVSLSSTICDSKPAIEGRHQALRLAEGVRSAV